MNKKGQAMVLGVMIAVFVFLAAVTMIQPLKDMIVIAREPQNLDCTNTSISTGVAATCLIVDLYLPYFIGAVIAAGIAFIFIKKVA